MSEQMYGLRKKKKAECKQLVFERVSENSDTIELNIKNLHTPS